MTTNLPKDYEIEQEAWWVQRWLDLLIQYRFKKRLERGRRYSRDGNILDLRYRNAKVTALVQGTAPEPYQLAIWLDSFTDEDWEYVVATLSERAAFSAQLLAGEMPEDIEAVFTANGLSLFPFTLMDVHSRCSCPDPENPCKHIAAVYYQLGDFFREDPFILFQLRGRSREQLLAALRQRRRAQLMAESGEMEPTGAIADSPAPGHPTPRVATPQWDLQRFWHYGHPLDPSLVVVTPSQETVLEKLSPIPLPSNDSRVVMAYLRRLYPEVAQWAAMRALNPRAE